MVPRADTRPPHYLKVVTINFHVNDNEREMQKKKTYIGVASTTNQYMKKKT